MRISRDIPDMVRRLVYTGVSSKILGMVRRIVYARVSSSAQSMVRYICYNCTSNLLNFVFEYHMQFYKDHFVKLLSVHISYDCNCEMRYGNLQVMQIEDQGKMKISFRSSGIMSTCIPKIFSLF